MCGKILEPPWLWFTPSTARYNLAQKSILSPLKRKLNILNLVFTIWLSCPHLPLKVWCGLETWSWNLKNHPLVFVVTGLKVQFNNYKIGRNETGKSCFTSRLGPGTWKNQPFSWLILKCNIKIWTLCQTKRETLFWSDHMYIYGVRFMGLNVCLRLSLTPCWNLINF